MKRGGRYSFVSQRTRERRAEISERRRERAEERAEMEKVAVIVVGPNPLCVDGEMFTKGQRFEVREDLAAQLLAVGRVRKAEAGEAGAAPAHPLDRSNAIPGGTDLEQTRELAQGRHEQRIEEHENA